MNARGLGRKAAALAAALVTTVLVTTALGGPVAAATSSGAPAPQGQEPRMLAERLTFSPNGDGVRDRLAVRFRLPVATTVQIRVEAGDDEITPFTVALGRRPAGRHTWTWNGRTPQGRLVPHGSYRIGVVTPQGRDDAFASVDLEFDAYLGVRDRYGAKKDAVAKVYPRSVEVRDRLVLDAGGWSDGMKRAVLTFRDADGKVALRRTIRFRPKWFTELVWEGRDARGVPLRPGRYFATLSGTDGLGNRGATKPLKLWVSQDSLVWREESRTMPAQEAWSPACFGSSWPECGLFLPQGEVTPSVRFPGGLTHRADPDPDIVGAAESSYFVAVPEAVRGLDAVRVAFAGEPTNPGETDRGHLAVHYPRTDATVVSSSSTAQTTWDEDPVYGDGQAWDPRDRRLPPTAWWVFWTEGDDAFDVATFTLDLRYLAVEKKK
ncbi:FlgD immunoglobulin-like domain containing protein [Nocardioides campestrisoli]|uniref:FlgD immunoglobulin-like domain containing protein n=1 Tax=Nocardioides campestrisoli TaxID=2736757 RepID=UPI00163DA461|nr:FlgD immunoglobulin-like domain containing protein [Nocardioides campestrisoli]